MNENIKKLALEAAQYSLLPASKYDEIFVEKFAQSLIHQSALIMETGVTAYPYQTFGDMVRDHFGVPLRYKKVDT